MPKAFKVSEVMQIVRKKLNLGRDQALFLMANGRHLMKQNSNLSDLFEKFKDEDGFFYITYASENTLGAEIV